jgi:hypothetical protein
MCRIHRFVIRSYQALVARLSNGECNVHVIGVNWPRHVFVSKSFEVVGAE